MDKVRKLTVLLMALAACAAQAASITFPLTNGDVASDGTDGWGYGGGTKPGESDVARFAKSGGSYTASDDVTFGSVNMMSTGTFNLDTSGSHTIKASNFYIGYHNVKATVNGGKLDLSVATSADANVPARQLAVCNQQGVQYATLTLAKGCIVTNASSIRLGYGAGGNTMKITDGSRVYTDAATLCNNKGSVNCTLEVSSGGVLNVLGGNFRDTVATSVGNIVLADTTNSIVVTGAGSKIVCPTSGNYRMSVGETFGRNSLLVTDGGEIVGPNVFVVGYNACGNCNRATFEDGAKFTLSGVRVGEYGSCGNTLAICGNATTGTCANILVGGNETASSGNTLVLSNASLSCKAVYISTVAGSSSNAFYIAGSGTSFTTTVTDVPRYSFFSRGSHNVFEMDGAEWNYWLNMQLDNAASSNTIRFVNGARMNMEGGLFSGTNHIASCGNRVYLGGGARVSLAFAYISRADNVFTVSNATLTAFDTRDSWNGLKFGIKLANVDTAGISGNGLVVQGDSPTVSAQGDIAFNNSSFLRFEVPAGGYAAAHVPISVRKATWNADSSLDVHVAALRGIGGAHTLISTTGGVTIPAEVLAAANASLAARTGGMARLTLENGGKSLALNVSKGISVSFR